MTPLLSAKEVAKILNVSVPLIYKMAGNGQLRTCSFVAESAPGKRSKKTVRFTKEDIEKFIQEHSN